MKPFYSVTDNLTLWAAVLSWAIAQIIKFTTELIRNRRVNFLLLLSGTGGMPSSHTSFVVAMTTSIGLLDGFDTPIFAVAAVVSLVVMIDAAGVRRDAGKHAAAINTIFESFEEQGLAIEKRLKELLGHSPAEVAVGAVLGAAVSLIMIGTGRLSL